MGYDKNSRVAVPIASRPSASLSDILVHFHVLWTDLGWGRIIEMAGDSLGSGRLGYGHGRVQVLAMIPIPPKPLLVADAGHRPEIIP